MPTKKSDSLLVGINIYCIFCRMLYLYLIEIALIAFLIPTIVPVEHVSLA